MEVAVRIAVFGAGGVGGYFGARLVNAGQDVTFIARGMHLEAIRRDGLRVSSIKGDCVVRPAHVTDDPTTVGTVDVVLVSVKAWQVPEIAPEVRTLLGPKTVVVPLQNGVEAADQLAAVLGREPVVGGLCKIMTAVRAPGHIEHSGLKPTVVCGELYGTATRRIERLSGMFQQAGVAVEVPADIHTEIWKKFLLIAPWGGMGAVTRVSVELIRKVPETRDMLADAMREVACVAVAHGVELESDIATRTLTFIDRLPPEATASMQRDLDAGRPSELEAQNGAVVRFGNARGIQTPVNAFIYRVLRPLELTARGTAC